MVKNKKQSLKLAAKAAGYEGFEYSIVGDYVIDSCIPNYKAVWNPLKNDGDSMRLIVDVGITLNISRGFSGPDETIAWSPSGKCFVEQHRLHNTPYIATRHAVVRAAASESE